MENFEEEFEDWTPPPMWHTTVLAYLFSNSKEEFEQMPEDDKVIVPVDGGNFIVSKKDLILRSQEEIKEYGEGE